MSKISAIQAEALGLKPSAPKKPAPPKSATAKPVAKPAATKAKPAQVKTAPKTVAKSTVTKTASKPKAKVATKKAPPKSAKKVAKKAKPNKVKMERDSFTMPKEEYAQITLMKARLTALGQPAKKSELLRAGIKLLAAMSDNTLKTTLAKIPVIKTGRPNKKS
jgi:activator of HSP90 ATPase